MITTNTGAKKLESSDNWREIFPNSTLGTAGAHNASVDAADRIQPEIAPIINGKQCALGAAKDDYVLLRNSTITGKSDGAYIAAKAIPANTDIDSTYLGNAITGGISNSINSNITPVLLWHKSKNDIVSNQTYNLSEAYNNFYFVLLAGVVGSDVRKITSLLPTEYIASNRPNGLVWFGGSSSDIFQYGCTTSIYFPSDTTVYQNWETNNNNIDMRVVRIYGILRK